MQPNWPAPSSGGREESRVQSSPSRVGCARWRLVPLHSRRHGSAKYGGRRAKSTVGQVALPSRGGELIADRAERSTPTEESGGISTPVAQAVRGRGALASSTFASCHCVQCPA